MSARVAFAVDATGLYVDDACAVSALAERDVVVDAVRWNDPAVDWASFDAVLPRSTWDYYHHAEAFAAWIRRTASLTHVFNPPAAVLWNAHKSYLGELARAGVPTVPTVWLWRDALDDIPARLAAVPWEQAIFKPAVSAGAYGLLHVARGDTTTHDEIAQLVSHGDGMLQPYLPLLACEGETSLLYFDGEFSHAVRRPSPFAHGMQVAGTGECVTPTPGERAVADQALATLPPDLLYARIDLAPSGLAGPLVMEIELIEPSLFFRFSPDGTARFAEGLTARIGHA